jgi:protein-tyrosine phosphatase
MSEGKRPILESYWVEPERFLAGEYPAYAYGEPMRQRLDAFLDFGITTFIDLTDPDELPPYLPLLAEQARYYESEVQHKRFAISDHNAPTPEVMQSILDEIDASLAEGHKIYLHCWGGIGRTGTVVGCYLVRHGLSGQEALERLAEWWQEVPKSRIWPYTPETQEQIEFVLHWDESDPHPSP